MSLRLMSVDNFGVEIEVFRPDGTWLSLELADLLTPAAKAMLL